MDQGDEEHIQYGLVVLGLSIVSMVSMLAVSVNRGHSPSPGWQERFVVLSLAAVIWGAALGLGCTRPIPAKRWLSLTLITGASLVSLVSLGFLAAINQNTEELWKVDPLAVGGALVIAVLGSGIHFFDQDEQLSYSKCPSCKSNKRQIMGYIVSLRC